MRAPRRRLGAVVLALGVVAAGCGGSSKPAASPATAGTIAASGANGFCSKLVNFPAELEQAATGATTSSASGAQAEQGIFRNLTASAPSSIKPAFETISSFLDKEEQDAASQNVAALQSLSQQAAQLGTVGTQIAQWEATHCHVG